MRQNLSLGFLTSHPVLFFFFCYTPGCLSPLCVILASNSPPDAGSWLPLTHLSNVSVNNKIIPSLKSFLSPLGHFTKEQVKTKLKNIAFNLYVFLPYNKLIIKWLFYHLISKVFKCFFKNSKPFTNNMCIFWAGSEVKLQDRSFPGLRVPQSQIQQLFFLFISS